MNKINRLWLLSLLLIFFSKTNLAKDIVRLFANKESPKVQFAIGNIQKALENKAQKSFYHPIAQFKNFDDMDYKILLLDINNKAATDILKNVDITEIDELKNEGFIIKKTGEGNRTTLIIGNSYAGVMYGGLEAAEIIQTRGIEFIENQFQNPYMKVRGTKFNIPLDVRTPTYTEPCDAAQNNMAEMWNFDFWKDYIDNLARYRYNTISLWNMHPFPSMVKVPEYPDVALDDVRKSTVEWEENYPLNGWDFDAPEIVNNYEVIKKITIEEKIEFWRKVMAYGKDRNVQFFILTWNIFDYGVEGKYGITDKLENQVTTDYFRQSIKQMVLTYPDLAGIGLTTGENMYDYTTTQKEEWAFATYGQGVLDAIKEQPDREIYLIHRQHQTQAKEISKIFKDV
ncbi:MAG: alpha-glucuronidase family glycosyl hydrolase, partial [Melioribacteraceae bacterium]|nr:alpha-glucuronidase family glycosyl hydrolase [Melioribacteraceae bacterium]